MIHTLHIDDNADDLELTRYKLLDLTSDFRIEWAESAHSALHKLEEEEFDCILSDFQMPELDGLGLLKILRGRGIEIPFIFLTGQGNEELAAEALRAGADDYFTKQTSFAYYERLINSIRRVVESYKQRERHKHAEVALRESEQRYRAFIEQSTEGIYRISIAPPIPLALPPEEQVKLFLSNSRIGECNDILAQMYGCRSAKELIGMKLHDFYGDPVNEITMQSCLDFVRSGYRVVDAITIEYDRAGNKRIFLNNSLGIIKDDMLLGSWGTQRDITEQHRTTEALKDSEAKYRSLFESSRDAVFICSDDDIIADINPSGLQLLGTSREEPASLSIREFFANAGVLDELRARLTESGYVKDYPVALRRADGAPFTALLTMTTLRGEKDRVAGYQGIIREEPFKELFENLFIGVYRSTPAGRFLMANTALARMFGYQTVKEFLEDEISTIIAKSSYDRRSCLEILDRRGELREIDFWVCHPDGSRVYLRENAGVVRGSDGKVLFYQGTIEELTDNLQAEKVKTTLYRIAEAAINTDSLEELYPSIRELLGELFDTTNFYIALRDDSGSLSMTFYVGEKEGLEIDTERLARGLTGYVFSSGKPLLAGNELQRSLAASGEVIIQDSSPEVWLGAPLKTDKGVIGVIAVQHSSDAKRYDEKDVEILGFVSGQVATAIERLRSESELRRHRDHLDRLVKERTAELEKINKQLVLEMEERQRAEEALKLSEERYTRLLELAKDGIQIVQDGVFRYVNPSGEAMLGYSTGDLLGMPLEKILAKEERTKVLEMHRQRLSGGKAPSLYQTTFLMKSGERIPVELSVNMVDFEGQKATVAVIRDITRRLKIEEDLKRSRDQLVARTRELEMINSELETFNYSVSHDLQAPLRAVTGYSRMLSEDAEEHLDSSTLEIINRIFNAGLRMGDIIESLLKLSRLTTGEMAEEAVDLSALARGIIDNLRGVDSGRDVQAVVKEGISVRGDARLLAVLMDNLLNNAWKFTSKSEQARIEFGAEEREGRRVYFVRDNGCGFDMNRKGQLFTPFQRLHSDAEFEGKGIGLATANRIVKRHGGRIWAESEQGQAATFFFTLGEQ